MTKLVVDKRNIIITNPDKIFFPKDKIAKLQIAEYYEKIGKQMIPYTKDRALTMLRFPHGINEEGFYHKDAPTYFPKWIKLFSVEKEDKTKTIHYVVANNVATLVYLANFGCLTPHLWLSKIDKPDYPDKIIFDLDPSKDKQFPILARTAKNFKKILMKQGLKPFVMTTGSRGIHVVIPIKRKYNFETVRNFAYQLAELLVQTDPENLTLNIRKDKREGKVFIDTLRNSFGATAVAPYAIRAKPGAPVATPIDWKELDNPKMDSQKYNIFNIFQKIKKDKDPWKDFNKSAKSIKI